ncbi:MAG: recombinase family protein [Leucobacter sp.]
MTQKSLHTAAIYTRISRDAEGNRVGVQRQEADCRALAEALGLEVSKVYSDNDIGASNRTGNKPRPAYAEMLQDARDGLIKTIIAYSNSRLTRRPLEWVALISLAEAGKIQIKTVASGSHDLTTADGRAVALTVAAWDSAEAERISERQTAAFHHRALQGKPKIQRQRAFGWEKDGLTIREEEARLIREAVEEILRGVTVSHIARKWEEQGVRTAAGGEHWEHSVLRRVLVGWRTAGVRTYKREPLYDEHGHPVMGTWDAIISLDDRSQALLALDQHTRKKKRQGKWLLSGLLRCGTCAKSLYGQLPSGSKTRATYACRKGHLSISAGILEQQVLGETINHIYTASEDRKQRGNAADLVEPASTDPAQVRRVDEISAKITELMDAYRAGILPAAIVFGEVDTLYEERAELQAMIDASKTRLPRRLPGLTGDAAESLELYLDVFKRPTPEPGPGQTKRDVPEEQPDAPQELVDDTNAMLRLAIESIVIRAAAKGLRPIDRVDIHWEI